MTKNVTFSRVFFWEKLCLVSWFRVWRWVIHLIYSWWNYLLNNFNLFIDFSRGLWYFIIDNTMPKCIYFLMRHIFQIVYQSTSSSEYIFFFFLSLFYLSTSSLFNFNLLSSSLLINFIVTYCYLISLPFEYWIFWQLQSCFQVSSCFFLFFECCECWLPCVRLTLHYGRPS